uniref:Metalloendopeptidase n=1 Tax=Sinocyclocheilus anshuiensis TaxID=1608454 RepID=A0A671MXZ3_9TELE
ILMQEVKINAKGVILKAFEQYRLKPNYIFVMFFCSIRCYSKVGNRQMGKQELSIGANCERLGTVEHEFLHALGFWHEQSMSDRDDYVIFVWDRIEDGKEHNFNLYDETVSSSLGVPYDYGSVMHYSKTAFNKDSEPTIVTKIPEFLDVIGQCMEFSDSDLLTDKLKTACSTNTWFLSLTIRIQPSFKKKLLQCFHYFTKEETKYIERNAKLLFILLQGLGSSCISAQPPKVTQLTWKVASFSPKDAPNACRALRLIQKNPDIQHRMNNIRMITTDPAKTSTDSMGNVEYFWDDPRKVGSLVTDTDGSSYYRGPGSGTSIYITHDRSFKGDNVIFLLSLEDVTGLVETQTRESWRPEIRDLRLEIDDAIGSSTTATVAKSVFVAAAMFLGLVLPLLNINACTVTPIKLIFLLQYPKCPFKRTVDKKIPMTSCRIHHEASMEEKKIFMEFARLRLHY